MEQFSLAGQCCHVGGFLLEAYIRHCISGVDFRFFRVERVWWVCWMGPSRASLCQCFIGFARIYQVCTKLQLEIGYLHPGWMGGKKKRQHSKFQTWKHILCSLQQLVVMPIQHGTTRRSEDWRGPAGQLNWRQRIRLDFIQVVAILSLIMGVTMMRETCCNFSQDGSRNVRVCTVTFVFYHILWRMDFRSPSMKLPSRAYLSYTLLHHSTLFHSASAHFVAYQNFPKRYGIKCFGRQMRQRYGAL